MNEPRVVESVTNECQSLGRAHESSSARAEQLIACLEGEIAKRDGELAACRVAVENCEVFRARIAELESRYQRDVYGLNNEGDPIGGDPAGGYANDNARLRSELAAIKAQGVVMPERKPENEEGFSVWVRGWSACLDEVARLNAAPVQQVSVPDGFERYRLAEKFCEQRLVTDAHVRAIVVDAFASGYGFGVAAPAAPAADAGLVEALELCANRLDRLALEQGEFWRGYATAWADEARATANGVKS